VGVTLLSRLGESLSKVQDSHTTLPPRRERSVSLSASSCRWLRSAHQRADQRSK